MSHVSQDRVQPVFIDQLVYQLDSLEIQKLEHLDPTLKFKEASRAYFLVGCDLGFQVGDVIRQISTSSTSWILGGLIERFDEFFWSKKYWVLENFGEFLLILFDGTYLSLWKIRSRRAWTT